MYHNIDLVNIVAINYERNENFIEIFYNLIIFTTTTTTRTAKKTNLSIDCKGEKISNQFRNIHESLYNFRITIF